MPDVPAAGKVCVVCGSDCSGKPRVKDSQGRYYCKSCHESAMRKPAAPKPAATAPSPGRRAAPPPAEAEPASGGFDNAMVLEGLETAGPANAGGLEPCPGCGAMVGPASVICMSCGFNRQTGRSGRTSVAKPPRERRMPSVPVRLGPGMVFLASMVVLGGLAAATFSNPDLFVLFLVIYLLFSLVATVMMVACPFMDGDNGWGILAVVSLVVPCIGLLMLYYVFFVSQRAHLKAVVGAALVAGVLMVFLALNLDPEILRDVGP